MIDQDALEAEIGGLLATLYEKRLLKLERLGLARLLQKNPFLYRSIGITEAEDWIDHLLLAFISSSDETIFGNDFFEPLALWSARAAEFPGDNRIVTVGAGAGQDVSIETETAYWAVAVKSGKNIFNSQSGKMQTAEFAALQSRLKKVKKQFRSVLGHGYGRKRSTKAGATEAFAGQKFWELLTGEAEYYLRIGRAIDHAAVQHRATYAEVYTRKRTALLRQFMINFVSEDGVILWDQVLAHNSAESKPAALKKSDDDTTTTQGN